MWAKHDNSLELVRNSWGEQVRGTATYRLCKKLKGLKEPLKSLNRLHYSHITARAQAAAEELVEMQQRLHDNSADVHL